MPQDYPLGPSPRTLAVSPPGARIRTLRQLLTLSQKEFAERVGLSQSTLSQIENDRYNPSYATIAFLAQEFDVDGNWLLKGGSTAPLLANTHASRSGFPAVHEKALAGYTAKARDEHWLTQLEHYQVPGFRPEADIVIFQALGDSMTPTVIDQDFILGERVTRTPENFTGQCMVCVTQTEIYVKRLANFDLVSNRLTLFSDNPKYKVIEAAWADILEVWHVVGRVTRSLAPSVLNQEYRIRQLEGSLQELTDAHDELRNLILARTSE